MEKKLRMSKPFEQRRGGVLLPVFSLPSLFGIGDFGPGAFRFLEMTHSLGLRYWHILPLGPTEVGRGNSPYSASSAFALNPLFVSPEQMLSQGLAEYADFGKIPAFPGKKIAYSMVETWKDAFLRRTWERNRHSQVLRQELDAFTTTHFRWLETYALFSSLKKRNNGSAWNVWGEASPQNIIAEESLREEIAYEQYVQFILFQQWKDVHDYAKNLGIMVLGDMPFYVDYDSADVWANRDLFRLDQKGSPLVVAGVPPDYYSKTGQRWGNPIYNWDAMRSCEYSWWVERVRHALDMCDALRLDHFRGFSAYWEIEASLPDAVQGKWVTSPGGDLFEHFQKALGRLPFFAEDLGVITQDVRDLRDTWGLPGMEILHFAFENYRENPYALHNHRPLSVVFTATHDNNTSRGWYLEDLLPLQQREVAEICGHSLGEGNVHRILTRMALESVAYTAIIPFQDILGLGSSGRINIPSTGSGNWVWRLSPEEMALSADQRGWFSKMLSQAGRC